MTKDEIHEKMEELFAQPTRLTEWLDYFCQWHTLRLREKKEKEQECKSESQKP